jgi:hypothetical protein
MCVYSRKCSEFKSFIQPTVQIFSNQITRTNVELEVLTVMVKKSTIFWDITPCSPLSVNRCFGRTYRLRPQCRKNKLSKKGTWKQVTFPTLKMEAICSSATSVDTQRNTRRYIPEDGTLRNQKISSDMVLLYYTGIPNIAVFSELKSQCVYSAKLWFKRFPQGL